MKLGLQNTIKKVLELIKNNEDFVVNECKTGLLIRIPYVARDVEPHVCDFKKAGVDDFTIAFYFAYLIALPECDVFLANNNKLLETEEKPKPADHVLFGKIENKYIDKVEEKRQKRVKREKEEKEEHNL